MSKSLLEHPGCEYYAWGKPVGQPDPEGCLGLENEAGEFVPVVVVVVVVVVVAHQGLEVVAHQGLEVELELGDECPQRVSLNEGHGEELCKDYLCQMKVARPAQAFGMLKKTKGVLEYVV